MLSSSETPNTPHEAQLDLIFQALSDSTRRQLLRQLATGPARVSDLAEPFNMSLPAVGKHLRVLERAGLLDRTISGRTHHCRLNALPLKNAGEWLNFYQHFWTDTLDALHDYFTEDAAQLVDNPTDDNPATDVHRP